MTSCISFNIGPVNTKLENTANLNVLFLTTWVLCCLSHNKVNNNIVPGLLPWFETRQYLINFESFTNLLQTQLQMLKDFVRVFLLFAFAFNLCLFGIFIHFFRLLLITGLKDNRSILHLYYLSDHPPPISDYFS